MEMVDSQGGPLANAMVTLRFSAERGLGKQFNNTSTNCVILAFIVVERVIAVGKAFGIPTRHDIRLVTWLSYHCLSRYFADLYCGKTWHTNLTSA